MNSMRKAPLRFNAKAIMAALLLPLAGIALTPVPAPEQTQAIALTNGTAHLGNGQVISNATITFDQGKITGVHSGSTNLSGHQVIDVGGQHIYPGFILPDSDLGLVEVNALEDTVDNRETGQLNPNIRSAIAYNTDSEMIPTLRYNGVLTAQVSPKGGLVSGTSSIFELEGWNWEDALLKTDDGIRVNWPSRKTGRFDFSTFTFNFVDNNQYDRQLQMVRQLFEDARAYADDNEKASRNLKLEAMLGLFDGTKRLYLACNDPRDIVLAIRFVKEQGIQHTALLAASGALPVAEFLAENDIPVIVTGLHSTPSQAHDDIDLPYRVPALLIEAGVKTGLTYPSLMNSRNLGFIAGTAAAYGLDKGQALRMITLTNAEILGVEDRLGSLAVGKDATLFVSAGDALDMRTNQLSHAFIEGKHIQLDGRQQELYQRFKQKYSAQ